MLLRTGFKFLVLVVIVVVMSEALIPRHQQNWLATSRHLANSRQKLRARRQNSEDCDNAQIRLYEHEHGEECMQIFYGDTDPFFAQISQSFVKQYCETWKCGEWAPPLMDNVTKYCDFSVSVHLYNYY